MATVLAVIGWTLALVIAGACWCMAEATKRAQLECTHWRNAYAKLKEVPKS